MAKKTASRQIPLRLNQTAAFDRQQVTFCSYMQNSAAHSNRHNNKDISKTVLDNADLFKDHVQTAGTIPKSSRKLVR